MKLSTTQAIERLKSFGFSHKGMTKFMDSGTVAPGILFEYKGKPFVAHALYFRKDRSAWIYIDDDSGVSNEWWCHQVKLADVFEDEIYETLSFYSQDGYKSQKNQKVAGVHLTCKFDNLLSTPTIHILKKGDESLVKYEQRVQFDTINHRGLDPYIFNYIQGNMPGGIFLDMLKEQLPQIFSLY